MSGARLLGALAVANLLFLAAEVLYNVLGLLASAR